MLWRALMRTYFLRELCVCVCVCDSDHADGQSVHTGGRRRNDRTMQETFRSSTPPASSGERLCIVAMSVSLSVCLSRRSTAAATCGWFAAELRRGQQMSIDRCQRPSCGSVMLKAEVNGSTQDLLAL